MLSPMEIAVFAGVAVILFGADKLPKLARGLGQAKKEFYVGQAEADVAAERAREEARERTAAASSVSPTPSPETTLAPPPPVVPASTLGGTPHVPHDSSTPNL